MKYSVFGPKVTADRINDASRAVVTHKVDNIGDLIGELWRRRGRLALGAVVGALLGLGLWFLTPVQYLADATLLVAPAATSSALDQGSDLPITPEIIRTEVGLFKARTNLLNGVEKLGLDSIPLYTGASKPGLFGALSSPPETPRGAAAEAVAKRLTVAASGQDLLIRLQYRDEDPRRAEQVLSMLIEGYFASRIDQAGVIANDTLQVLDRQADQLREQAEAATAAAEAFRQEKDLPNLRQGSTEEQEIVALTGPLSEMRAERARLVAALDTSDPTAYGQLAEVRNSETIQQLREVEAELVAKEAGASVTGRRNSADIREVEAQIARVRSLIDDATGEIVSGLRARRTALDEGIDELEGLIRQRRTSVRESDSNRAEQQRLEQAAEAAQQIYLSYSIRAAEVSARGRAAVARVIETAPPRTLDQPDKIGAPLYVIGGGFLGTLAAAMTVAAAGLWNRKIMSRNDFLRAGSDCVTLPFVPALNGDVTAVAAYVRNAPTSEFAETVRGLVAQLLGFSNTPTAVVLVTSPSWGAARGTVAVAMAAVAANDGLQVLLVEGDLRRPDLGARLGQSEAGTEAVLQGDAPLRTAVSHHALGFYYLTVREAGLPSPGALSLKRLLAAVDSDVNGWDMVLIEASPVLAVSDGLQMAANVPQCLLVAEAGTTEFDELETAISRLSANRGPRIFGVLASLTSGRRAHSTPDYTGS